MSMSEKILVVEDEPALQETLVHDQNSQPDIRD